MLLRVLNENDVPDLREWLGNEENRIPILNGALCLRSRIGLLERFRCLKFRMIEWEKCGFIKEGTIRQGKMLSVYCDYNIYGMLREDYLTQSH